MYVNTVSYTSEDLARLWFSEYCDIPLDWNLELRQWFFEWVRKNHAVTRSPKTRSLESCARHEAIHRIRQKIRTAVEKEFQYANNPLKKGMLKAYRQSEQYLLDQQTYLDSHEEFQLLLSDADYFKSSSYQSIYSAMETSELEAEFNTLIEEAVKVMQDKAYQSGMARLKKLNLHSCLAKFALESRIFSRLETYLSQSRIPYINNKYPNLSRIILIVESYRTILLKEGIISFMSGHSSISEYACHLLLSRRKALKVCVELSSQLKADLIQMLENTTGLTSHFQEQLTEFLSPNHFYELLLKNPHYSEILQEALIRKQTADAIQRQILQHIPARYEYLYPKARGMLRHFILHIGPTNSGKTWQAMNSFREAKSAIYLAPLRLLAYEAYEETNRLKCPCNMITGEEENYTEGASHTACTIETADFHKHYDVCVIDEAQMIGDKERGHAWTAAILGIQADTIHICSSQCAQQLLIHLIELCGDSYEIITHKRSTPLFFDTSSFVFPRSIQKHDALIAFSKRSVLHVAAELQQKGWKVSIIYGALPYESRQNEVNRFLSGETDIIVSTDAIGMGMNLPIRRIIFLETEKFDGQQVRKLHEQEIKQIAGRAGRRGIYDIGYFTSAFNKKWLNNQFNSSSVPITSAYISFPETLLCIPNPLSELLEQWNRIPSDGILIRTNHTTEIELAKELENHTDNKNLIYQFISIPFDERIHEIRTMWKSLFLEQLNQPEVTSYQEAYLIPEAQICTLTLDTLELEYKKCDLLYNYFRKFQIEQEKETVLQHKKKIADLISAELARQKLPGKKCRMCGKMLPWNFPHRNCDDCYHSQYDYHYEFFW